MWGLASPNSMEMSEACCSVLWIVIFSMEGGQKWEFVISCKSIGLIVLLTQTYFYYK